MGAFDRPTQKTKPSLMKVDSGKSPFHFLQKHSYFFLTVLFACYGTEEYWRALDQNLSETMIGRMQPKEALDRTYKEWNEITERRGKAKQLKQYQEAVGYKN